MVRVRDVRRQCKDYRRLRQRAIWSLWQIQRRVQFDFVAHRNLNAPAQVVIRGWLCGGWHRSWRLRNDICCKECIEHPNPKASFHGALLKMNYTSETRVLSCSKKGREESSHFQSPA